MLRIVPVVIYLVLILWQSNCMVHQLLKNVDARLDQQEQIERINNEGGK